MTAMTALTFIDRLDSSAAVTSSTRRAMQNSTRRPQYIPTLDNLECTPKPGNVGVVVMRGRVLQQVGGPSERRYVPFEAGALELLLPNGITRWVALLSAVPDVAAGTYAQVGERVPCSVWEPVATARANGDEIAFGSLVGSAVVYEGWAIFDAAVLGSMIAAGPLLNLAGEPAPQYLKEGNNPGVVAYDLVLKFED